MLAQMTSAALLAALPTPTLLIDQDGQVQAANAAAVALFEYQNAHALQQLNVTQLLAQHERARLDPLAWLKKWAERPDAPELDYIFLTCTTGSGALRYLSVRVARLLLEHQDEDAVGYLVSMHDMTQWQSRFRAEQDAHRLAARLLSITADGVLIIDADHAITYANESVERMLGYRAGELLGKPLNALIPSRLHERHDADIAAFTQSKQPSRLMAGRTPVTALTRSGTEIRVDVSITRVSPRAKQNGGTKFCALIRPREDA